MKVDIYNPKQALSHFVLHVSEKAKEIAETAEWTEKKEINAKIFFNGVEVSGEDFESVMEYFVSYYKDHYAEKYAEKYADVEQAVEDRAQKLIKEHADNALDVLVELQDKLYNAENLLKPHWEREETKTISLNINGTTGMYKILSSKDFIEGGDLYARSFMCRPDFNSYEFKVKARQLAWWKVHPARVGESLSKNDHEHRWFIRKV